MQGAAQTANAAPSSTLEPRLPGAGEEARRQDPLGPRQQPDESEAEDDEDQAGELGLPLRRQHAADRRRARAEDDEDDGEAGDERNARKRDVPRRPGLAEPVGLDRGNGREVSGNQRQHAGRDHRDEPREERQRDAFSGWLALVEAGELVVDPALESGIDARDRGGGLTAPSAPAPGERREDEPSDEHAHDAAAATRAGRSPSSAARRGSAARSPRRARP